MENSKKKLFSIFIVKFTQSLKGKEYWYLTLFTIFDKYKLYIRKSFFLMLPDVILFLDLNHLWFVFHLLYFEKY